MSWTISQVKNGGWRTDARFVEVAAYDGAVAERDALQARLDEAVESLQRLLDFVRQEQSIRNCQGIGSESHTDCPCCETVRFLQGGAR